MNFDPLTIILVLAGLSLFGPAIVFGMVIPIILAIRGEDPDAANRRQNRNQADDETED